MKEETRIAVPEAAYDPEGYRHMTADQRIYRVRTRRTGSLQPGGSHWQTIAIHYVGESLTQARIEFHKHEPFDAGGGHGNSCVETLLECCDQADLSGDEPGAMTDFCYD
jgi:hypothetical protein